MNVSQNNIKDIGYDQCRVSAIGYQASIIPDLCCHMVDIVMVLVLLASKPIGEVSKKLTGFK